MADRGGAAIVEGFAKYLVVVHSCSGGVQERPRDDSKDHQLQPFKLQL